MKKTILTTLFLGVTFIAFAQETKTEIPQWINNLKLSGYGMLQYQAQDKYEAHDNTFNLRIARMALEGRIGKDFYWKTQIQISGNTSSVGSSPRLVDLVGEWQKYKFFMVKAGQFKRPFSFENPMHPITQGFMSYSQNIVKLVGFSDRSGEQSSNGRDIGIQVQGDFLENANGRSLLHYQIGIFNGEGINKKDADNRKDIIGGLWVMPVKGLRIGAFGWTGSHVIDGVSTPKNRYALSAEYVFSDWTLRSEYIHNQGYGSNLAAGDKADGFYVFGIVPVIKSKLHAKARYNTYRVDKTSDNEKTMYEVGLNYFFTKNLQLTTEYARVNERATDSKYNFVDIEVAFRF